MRVSWQFHTPAALSLGKYPPAPAQLGYPLKLFRMSSKEVDTVARVVRLIEIPFEPPEVETDNACVCVSPPPHTHTQNTLTHANKHSMPHISRLCYKTLSPASTHKCV